VTKVPEHCFVGISKPAGSIEEARQQAILSVTSQILQAMGARYSLNHVSILTGTTTHSLHQLNEKLSFTANWFIHSVQQSIVKSEWYRDDYQYVYFVLVHFSPSKINRLRKLTLGPKVSAKIVRKTYDKLVIEVIENNGVRIILTDYNIKIAVKNRYARIITMFFWKVPEFSIKNFDGIFSVKVSLKENSKKLILPNPIPNTGFKPFILGIENQIEVILRGYDEIGRPLSFPVKKF
jgi:hypothetical protein